MQLSKLARLNPRQAWANEASDFTPWLAEDENFRLLAEVLHLEDAEVEGTEKSIGDFSADIIGRDRDGYILIENQLEQTDHGHLGQILTYLAGLEASAKVIWISTRVREEHRAAIDWLNEETSDRYSFFAVELELVKIDNSASAPLFQVVAKPNEWTRHITRRSRQISNTAQSERQKKYQEFWNEFAAYLDEMRPGLRGSNPPKDHWWNFPVGRSDFAIVLTAGARDLRIGVELYIHNDPEKVIFNHFEDSKTAIEDEIDYPLLWERLADRKASKIAVRWENVDPMDHDVRGEIFEWYLSKLEDFRTLFSARCRELDIPALASSD